MPGITGTYIKKPDGLSSKKAWASRARQINILCHLEEYRGENLPSDDHHLFAALVTDGKFPGQHRVYQSNKTGQVMAFHGIIYNLSQMLSHYQFPECMKPSGDPLLDLFNNHRWDWIKIADGVFSIAIYNPKTGILEVAADRLGLSHIYYYDGPNQFAFAPEIKGVLAAEGTPRKISPDAVRDYFTYGYFLMEDTWFDAVKILPAGAAIKVTPDNVTIDKIWGLNQIKPLDLDYNEAVEHLGHLWQQAVESRLTNCEKPVIPLSGGLDSRAVLAAIPNGNRPMDCFTFSASDCDDAKFASQAAGINGDNHKVFRLDQANWLTDRAQRGVWWPDGQVSLIHGHDLHFYDYLRNNYNANLDGFIGDLVFGGGYIDSNDTPPMESVISKLYAARPLGMSREETVDKVRQLFIQSGLRPEYFAMMNRVRRFTMMGTNRKNIACPSRLPFIHRELLDCLFGLPVEWRQESKIYGDVLVKYYPQYFKNIPWQKTGLPVKSPKLVKKLFDLYKRGRRKLEKYLPGVFPGVEFFDYVDSLRKNRERIEGILLGKDTLWRDYLNGKQVETLIERFMTDRRFANGIRADAVVLLITFEIYLQYLARKF